MFEEGLYLTADNLQADLFQVLPVAAFRIFFGQCHQVIVVDITHSVGYFFDAANFAPLSFFDHAYKLAGIGEGIECAGIEPGGAAVHDAYF